MTRLGSRSADPLVPVRELVPDIPVEVSDAIERAMAINSEERFASVEEFWQHVRAHAVATPVTLPRLVADPASTPPVESAFPLIEDVPTAIPARVQVRKVGAFHTSRKKSTLTLFYATLGLIALHLGALFAASFFPKVTGPEHSSRTAATALPKNATRSSASTPSKQSTAVTEPTRGSSPSTTPTLPTVLGYYSGQISDQATNPATTTSMVLANVRQSGATLTGDFTVGSELQGSGPFTGRVSTDKHVQFLVSGYAGHLPLFFQGSIQADESIMGHYCSYDQNQCNDAVGGYGTWQVAPLSPQSLSPSSSQSSASSIIAVPQQTHGNGHGKQKRVSQVKRA